MKNAVKKNKAFILKAIPKGLFAIKTLLRGHTMSAWGIFVLNRNAF